MQYRILSVGIDSGLLRTRQAVLASQGYDCVTATARDVDEKVNAGTFDLVILSVMIDGAEKRRILATLPAGTRPLVLESIVLPDQLLGMVAEAHSDRHASSKD
jgi:DNA-binding response OmpR family regulator